MTIINKLAREMAKRERKIRKAENQLDALQERALRMLAEQNKRLNK